MDKSNYGTSILCTTMKIFKRNKVGLLDLNGKLLMIYYLVIIQLASMYSMIQYLLTNRNPVDVYIYILICMHYKVFFLHAQRGLVVFLPGNENGI